MSQRTWVWLLLATVLACRETSAPADASTPIQTNALAYDLDVDPVGYTATIDFVFTNPNPVAVYVINCGGNAPPSLEKFVAGVWITAWSPIVPACLSPPIVIAGGQRYPGSRLAVVGTQTPRCLRRSMLRSLSGIPSLVTASR